MPAIITFIAQFFLLPFPLPITFTLGVYCSAFCTIRKSFCQSETIFRHSCGNFGNFCACWNQSNCEREKLFWQLCTHKFRQPISVKIWWLLCYDGNGKYEKRREDNDNERTQRKKIRTASPIFVCGCTTCSWMLRVPYTCRKNNICEWTYQMLTRQCEVFYFPL